MTKGAKKDERPGAEEKYKALVETAADAIFTLDLLGRFTFVNPAAERISGYSEEEVVGKHFRELLPTKHIPACLNAFQKALRGQPTPPIEIEMITKEGERVPLELLGRPVKRGRRVVEIIGSARDITERKQAEERLRKSEERYKKQFEEAMDAILIADAETGIIVDCNRVASELVGREKSELVGKHQRILHPPEQIEGEFSRTFKQHLKEKEGQVLETQVITKKGEIKDVAIKASTFELEGQKMILGIFRDITERKRAEEALREAEENFRAVAENANDGILVAVGEGVHVYVNKRAAEITGYSVAELLETDIKGLVHPDEFEKIMERYRKRLAGKPVPTRYETIFIRKDGKSVPVEFTAAKTVWQGEPASVVFFRDITERKRAEEELKESEERLETIFDSAQTGILVINAETHKIVDLNATAMEMMAIPKEQIVGNVCHDFVCPAEKGRCPITDLRQRVDNSERVLIKGDGESIPILKTVTSAMLQDREHLIESFIDITERKRAEEEIRHRSKQLALINEVGQRIAPILELTELYQTVVEAVQEKFGYQYVVIFSVGDDEATLEAIAGPEAKTMPSGYTQKIGEGMVGWVAQTGETLLANDVTKEPRFLPLEFLEIAAELAVPIRLGGKTIGVLVVNSDRPNIFTEADVTTLETIADQVARAIENARLYEEGQQQRQEAETLRQAAQALSATLDLQQVFESILSELQKVVPYDSASVQLLKGDRLEIIGGHGFPNLDELLGISFPVEGDNPNRQVMARRAPFIVEDAPAVYSAFREEPHAQASIRAWLGVPLLFGDRLIGMIALDKRVPGFYTEEHARLALAFAAQAAIVIENARLYEEAQKRLTEITALHEVSEVINSTLDLKEVFQRVVEELSQTFGYRLVDIYLLEKEGLRLQGQVGYDAETIIELIPLDQGVTGRVARIGQPALVPDVSQDPDYIPAYPQIKSEICVPITSGEELLGTLNVECDEKRPLTDDDLQLLSTLSSHIGVAIENARLFEKEQRLSTQRKAIAEVGRTAAAILDMDTLLSRVVHLIAQGFGYYRVHIFQVDQDSGYAVYRAGTGKAGLVIAEAGFCLKVGEQGLVGWVARHGEPLLVNDVSKDPRYYSHPELPDTRSELDAPIRIGERIIGVLDVQSTDLDAFEEGDLETLQTLADQLAVAMENARLYQETKRLAITDSLTGLYNLRYFYEALEREIQRSERYHRSVSLIMLDIDGFKAYNDLYGHLAGDALLIELAQLMSKVTRRTDTLARYGGEEFAIILPETETEGARFLAERLLEEVREHRFSMQDSQTIGRITISLGVATYPHHADSAKTLVHAADKALLRAKQAGKNRLSVCGEELIELEPR